MKAIFRKQVIEQSTYSLEGDVNLSQPQNFVKLTTLILSMVVFAILFLSLTEYKRKEVVTGSIEPESGVISTVTYQSGIVEKIMITEGQHVEIGQPLVLLTTNNFSPQEGELNERLRVELHNLLENMNKKKEYETEQYLIRKKRISNHINSMKMQLSSLNLRHNLFIERLDLNTELLINIEKLKGTGYMSTLDHSRQKDSLLTLRQQEESLKLEKLSLSEEIQNQESLLTSLPLEYNVLLLDVESSISELRNRLIIIEHEQNTVIKAQISGFVSGIRTELKQNISSGTVLLNILPDNSLFQANVYVATKSIGQIKLGQESRLRLHAFPYERYGVLNGKVKGISQTITMPSDVSSFPNQEPNYKVIIELDQQFIEAYGKQHFLRSGMTIDADIVTEKLSLIDWLLSPIYSIRGTF